MSNRRLAVQCLHDDTLVFIKRIMRTFLCQQVIFFGVLLTVVQQICATFRHLLALDVPLHSELLYLFLHFSCFSLRGFHGDTFWPSVGKSDFEINQLNDTKRQCGALKFVNFITSVSLSFPSFFAPSLPPLPSPPLPS